MFINAASNVNYLHATEFARNHQNKTTDNPINANTGTGDTVHISDEAYQAYAAIQSSNSSITVNLDTKTAAKYAKELAGRTDLQRVYPNVRTGVATDSSGNPVTDASRAAFTQLASKVAAGRLEVYQAGMASGKTLQQILADMVGYMDQQSPGYLSQTNWHEARSAFLG
ncbi:hypothetical protein [Methylomonas sp. MgM2]